MTETPTVESVLSRLSETFPDLLGDIQVTADSSPLPPPLEGFTEKIIHRSDAIHRQVLATVAAAHGDITAVIDVFLRWMRQRTHVRVLGAGRARLAVSIPAHRLAHGGARVYIQDDFVPMAHTIKGGAILAASASGKTESVLSIMRLARRENRDVEIVGIAAQDAHAFRDCCDIFIPISPELADYTNPLRALADSEEFVIALALDALVAAAGRKGGFIDALWRIGHENLGPTGPYNHKTYRPALATQTLDYTSTHELVGRAEHLNALRNQLLHKTSTAILINGPSGVGKTALSNRLLEIIRTGALADCFNSDHWTSAYRETWEAVITKVGQAVLGKDQVIKARVEEIEERLLVESARRRIFIAVDNLEAPQVPPAAAFLRRWSTGRRDSVFLVTSINRIPISANTALHIDLEGVPPDAQLDLLGKALCRRFGDDDLLHAVERVRGIPINLLYLRWLDPQHIDRLHGHVEGLVAGSLDKSSALEGTLLTVTRSPTPFLALGIIRSLEFSETLLAYFWDCLGGGSAESYTETRDRFLCLGLLIQSARSATSPSYRVAEDIHKDLYRILCSRIGEERVSTIHLFAAEYYRRQLDAQAAVPPDDVTSFLHHCFECGEFQWAYSQLFEADTVGRLQRSGMALQVRSVLTQLREHEAKFTVEQRCRILIAEASAANDLSEFETCLTLKRQAEDLLRKFSPAITPSVQNTLRREIEYFSAVAFSNIGRSAECVRSYLTAIAAFPTLREHRSILSLAYLAHELKYHDLSSSLWVGDLALRVVKNSNWDAGLISRVLCSLAESKIFSGDIQAADAYFAEGAELCGSGEQVADPRELGRILKNWALVSLLGHDWQTTKERLLHARQLSDSVGDRRRVASGDLYRSILLYKQGDQRGGTAVLEHSIRQLTALRDGRYLIPAILTHVYWNGAAIGTTTELLQTVESCSVADLPTELRDKSRITPYVRFWHEYFQPILLR